MTRKFGSTRQIARIVSLTWSAMSRSQRVFVGIVVVVAFVVAAAIAMMTPPEAESPQKGPGPDPSRASIPAPAAGTTSSEKTVVFCHWNLENLFDDRDDPRRQPDEDFDNWFAKDAAARTAKYQRLATILLRMNDGAGPDLIVGNEVESLRAADLLRTTLNAALPEGAARYEFVAMVDLDAGRHIAPCVISRYPLSGARLLGRLQRILEIRVQVNGRQLVLIGSHWTSQISDKGGDPTRGRGAYASTIYNACRDAIRANPAADILVCGDFNDDPDSDPVRRALHVTDDPKLVTTDTSPPRLFGPLSGKSPAEFGTHFYTKPLIYDQICLSAGMLDTAGWSYVAQSIRVPTDGLIRAGDRSRRPWRFGSRTDSAAGRGYSDHFPVVATLKVAP